MTTYYELLGVPPGAKNEVIKTAFRKALKEHHPDLHRGDASSERHSKKIIEAYDVLKDPEQRAFYDHALRYGRVQRLRLLAITLLTSMGLVSISSLVLLYLFLAPKRGAVPPEIVAAAPAIEMPSEASAPVVASAPSLPAPREAAWSSIERSENMAELWSFLQAYPNTAEGDLAASRLERLIDAVRDEKERRAISGTVTGRVAQGVQARFAELAAARGDVTASLPRREQLALAEAAPPPETAERASLAEETIAAAQDVQLTPPPHDDLPATKAVATAPTPDKYDLIIASLDRVILRHPADSQAHLERGLAWLGKDDLDRAMTDFDIAINLDDTNIPAFHRRGLLWFRRGEIERALADLDRAVRLSFADPKVYRDRGMIWFTKNSYDRAIADFDRAIKLAPNFAQVYLERGLAYQRKGDNESASANFDEAKRHDPTLANIFRSQNAIGPSEDLPQAATTEVR
jgi:tetratricopeptide (TPR) repeat protein